MIRTLIIDDDLTVRAQVQLLLAQHPAFILIGVCGSVAEAKILIPATKPDLLLLDIELNDGSSFDLLKLFGKYVFQVVFITANHLFAIKAIKCGALDYLMKPIDESEFTETLQRMTETKVLPVPFETAVSPIIEIGSTRKRLVLRLQQYLLVVAFDEIIYCQSNTGYTTFFLRGNRKEMVSNPIKEYEQLLPETLFIKPHQSYIVNNNFIDRYDKEGFLILKNGVSIPVATRKKDYVVKYLTEG